LSNKNENATVAKKQKFCKLNKASKRPHKNNKFYILDGTDPKKFGILHYIIPN